MPFSCACKLHVSCPLSHVPRRLVVLLGVARGLQTCRLCDNRTFPCHPAMQVPSGKSNCEIRKAAWVRPAWGCQGGLFLQMSVQVYDESIFVNPDVPTFNVHVFRNFSEIDYRDCSKTIPVPVKSFLLQSCTGFQSVDVGFLQVDQSRLQDSREGPVFVVECLNPDGCSIRLQYENSCTLKGTGAYPLGVIGITLCSAVLLFCLITRYYFEKHRRFVTMEMMFQLSAISLIMILNLVFWICFLMTSEFVFPYWYTTVYRRPLQSAPYSQITDTVFWVDKVVLVLSCLVHLGFLYQFVVAVHAQWPKILRYLFIGVAVVIIGCIGIPIPYYLAFYHTNGQDMVPYLIAFYSITYGFQIVESFVFLIYGLLLLKTHRLSHVWDRKMWKTVILLVLLVLPNVGRLVAILFSWLRFYFAVMSGNFNELFFAGFDYFQMRFRSHQSARLFFVFGFLIPDVVPYIVLLLLLFDVVYQNVNGEEKRESECCASGEPLLQRISVPPMYKI